LELDSKKFVLKYCVFLDFLYASGMVDKIFDFSLLSYCYHELMQGNEVTLFPALDFDPLAYIRIVLGTVWG